MSMKQKHRSGGGGGGRGTEFLCRIIFHVFTVIIPLLIFATGTRSGGCIIAMGQSQTYHKKVINFKMVEVLQRLPPQHLKDYLNLQNKAVCICCNVNLNV